MLTLSQVDRIATQAALKALSASSLLRTLAEETTDSEGQEAILVTLVINDLQRSPVTGDDAADAIVNVRQGLQSAGEDRTVIIEFATEEDLKADGGA